MVITRFNNDDKKNCRFEVQREERWIHTLDTHATYMVNSCQGKVAVVQHSNVFLFADDNVVKSN